MSDDCTSEILLTLVHLFKGDGNVNTIDFIFQSWPIFISLNPEYIRMMFEPILSYLDAGRFPRLFTIHDIGTHYPNATGHDDGVAEHMPIFSTSSLFILLYAYQKLSGDTEYAAGYEKLLKGYADWLAEPRSLYPRRQLISVDVIRPSANQTGLAIQAAIGLEAAAQLLGDSTYSEVAASNVEALYYGGLGLDGSSPADSEHFTYNYGRNKTWNVLFPSYSDVVLDLRTFPQEAWDMQSDWYLKQMKDGGLKFAGPSYGYPGNNLNWGLTDWSQSCPHNIGSIDKLTKCRYRRCISVFRSRPGDCGQHHTRLHDQRPELYTVWHQVHC